MSHHLPARDRAVVACLNCSLLLATFLGGFASTARGQAATAPFQLSWVAGSCGNCEIVRNIGEMQLTGERAIWAVGYSFPTQGEGAGDYSVIHSSDSGRNWTEVARSRMHATEPSLSFLDSRTGWMSGMSVDASAWVLRTKDAGSHWTKISDHFIQNMHFIDPLVGVGDEFDGQMDLFAKTTDGGRTWTTLRIAGVKFISKIFFISPEVGWIAGTNGLSDDLNSSVAVVLRTTDGGQHWTSSRVPSREGVAEIRDLYFLNESVGWLITWHYNNDGTHLYRTSDGGQAWSVHPDATIQGPGRWLSAVRFLNPRIGFAFSRDDEVVPTNEPGVQGVLAIPEAGPTQPGRILYTDDGGERWKRWALAAWVYDCQVTGQTLECSGSRDRASFSTLRLALRGFSGGAEIESDSAH